MPQPIVDLVDRTSRSITCSSRPISRRRITVAILSFPFLVFAMPILGGSLTHAKATGYDRASRLVPQASLWRPVRATTSGSPLDMLRVPPDPFAALFGDDQEEVPLRDG